MIEIEKNRIRKTIPKILDALKKKGFDPYFFEKADEARHFITERIEPQETVGIGGSVTFREGLGIVESLRNKGIYVCDHWDANEDPALRMELKRKQRGMDVFLSSVNALTPDGVLTANALTTSGPPNCNVADAEATACRYSFLNAGKNRYMEKAQNMIKIPSNMEVVTTPKYSPPSPNP